MDRFHKIDKSADAGMKRDLLSSIRSRTQRILAHIEGLGLLHGSLSPLCDIDNSLKAIEAGHGIFNEESMKAEEVHAQEAFQKQISRNQSW